MSRTYSAGVVTAYGAAKTGGYTGTYEEFCRQQAEYAENAEAVENAKTAAQEAQEAAEASQVAAYTSAEDAQAALQGMVYVTFSISGDGHVLLGNGDLTGTTSFALTSAGHMEVTY